MTMKINILYLLLPLFWVCSCAKVESPSLAVSVLAEVEDGAQKTKGVVEGDGFKGGDTFGLFVYHAGSAQNGFQSYGSKYANIKASRENGKWYYTLNGSSNSEKSESFFLIESSIGGALDIYAYAPHIDGTTSITDIPFTIGGDDHSKLTDLMWAGNLNGDNLGIALKGVEKTIDFKFKHALAMIRINLSCKYPGATMQISSIKIRSANQTPLYASGHFNAVTQVFAELVTTQEVVFGCNNYTFKNTPSLSVPLLIVPTEYQNNGDYEIVFEFYGHELPTVYPIQLADIAVNGVSKFESGKVYDFKFVFNNYAQISNVEIDTGETWESVTENREF